MIELFVNNYELVLASDSETTFMEENPEMTQKGEYSLDIEISLLEPKNAIAFSFLNRLNVSNVGKTAPARMIVDGIARIGSIIIISNSDTLLTCQFVSGNSELYYNTKQDSRKIWELDWGTETPITYERALQSINNVGYFKTGTFVDNVFTGYKNNFVCTPVLVGDKIYNNYTINDKGLLIPSHITGIKDILMQPYLKYYIDKLPSLLGYELTYNVLSEDRRLNVMYLLNSVDSLKYADALPNLTIAEFIKAIEEFFNVDFIVDSKTKTISIQNMTSSLSTKKTVQLGNVLDSYVRDLSQDPKLPRYGFTRIAYDFTDNLYFKYQDIAPSVLAKCKVQKFNTLNGLIGGITTYLQVNPSVPLDEKIIYVDEETGNEYFFGSPTILNLFSTKVRSLTEYICLINKFKSYGTDETNTLILKIQPAEVRLMNMNVLWYLAGGGEFNNHLAYQLPVCGNQYFVNSEVGFASTVENGVKDVPRSDKLEVALFTGKIRMFNVNTWQLNSYIDYPFSHTDFYPEFGCYENQSDRFERFETWRTTYFKPTTTMRLNGANGVIADYAQAVIVDSSQEYVFTLEDGPGIAASNVFIHNNLKYMPISFERKKSTKSTTVEGTFYRMLV